MSNKFKIESNKSVVSHIDGGEIYFSIKDINQKVTTVSISEIYRALKNVETALGRNAKGDWFESVGTE